MFSHSANSVFGTAILNTDLTSQGFNVNQRYRLIRILFKRNLQNFNFFYTLDNFYISCWSSNRYSADVMLDQNTGLQSAYNYIYFVPNNEKVSDQNDTYSKKNVTGPCSSNPCQNGGACLIGFNSDYVCYCTNGFGGNYLK